MNVIIKPINPNLGSSEYFNHYREFENVANIASTFNGRYILEHENGLLKVEFQLPTDCYLIIEKTLED